MTRLNRFGLVLIAAALVAAGILLVPYKLPYSIEALGRLMPERRWVLARGNGGQLVASMFNHRTGMSEDYFVSQFAREGAMRFTLDPSISADGVVAPGDTVGSVYSSETQERLVVLAGQLSAAEAALAVSTGGEKESVIREYQLRLVHARERAAAQQKILARLREMWQRELVSQQEYEIAEAEGNLLEMDISIAESQLEAARTGEKPELISLFRARIEALRLEIGSLQGRVGLYSIVCPIGGKVSRVLWSDTLVVVSDTTSYVAFVPVKRCDYAYLSNAQQVNVSVNGVPRTVRGQLLPLDQEVRLMNGEEVLVATALITEFCGDLMPGMIARCAISCEPVTVVEYVRRFLAAMLT